jgi:chromosome segregation ATPase
MGNASKKAEQPAPDKAKGAAAPPVDERDAATKRLEAALAEERDNAATLRRSNDELRFKVEILEKSYAKQLADARSRMETAQRELTDLKTKQATLGSGGEDTLRILSDVRAQLANATMERDQLRTQLSRREGRKAERPSAEDATGTINALILGVSSLREGAPALEGGGHLQAKVQATESPTEDMIAPELVFTKGSKDEDDD